MGAIATLGRAFISVHADMSPFAREVRRAMRRLATDIREDTDRAGSLLGQRLGLRAREGFRRSFGRRAMSLDFPIRITPASAAATELAIRRITRDRRINVRINRRNLARNLGVALRTVGIFALAFTRILGDLFNFGRQIGLIFGEAFKNLSNALGGTANATVTVGAAFAQLAASMAALAAIAILLAGIFGVLLAVASALYQALLLILVLLPGLGAAFLFAIAPLVLVFSNLGDALGELTKPMDQFQQAIEELPEHTGQALSSLRGLVDFFKEFRSEAQEAFFEPINRALDNFQQNLGPTFQAGFIQIANAAGEFAASLIELFDHPAAQRFFDDLFSLAELGIDDIGDAVVELIGAFGVLIDETFPELRRATMGIGDVIRGWARSIEDFATDPGMRDTLREWEESFDVIVELMGTMLELAGALLDGFRDDGIPVLQTMNDQMEGFIEFLESPAGEEFFDGLRISAEGVLAIIVVTLAGIVSILQLVGAIEELFSGDLRGAIEGINSGPLATMTGTFSFLLLTLLDFIDQMRVLFGRLGVVDGILSIIAGRLVRSRDLVRAIRDWFTRVRDRINNILGRGRTLNGIFTGAVNRVSRVADFFQTIINRISTAIGFARTLSNTLSNIRIPSLGGLNPFGAHGGIFTRPTSMIIGEAGPEVLIPLTRPQRARELVAASGLMAVVRGGDGASVPSVSGAGGQPIVRLVLQSDGTTAGDAIMEILRRGVRIRGGSVQTVLGSS